MSPVAGGDGSGMAADPVSSAANEAKAPIPSTGGGGSAIARPGRDASGPVAEAGAKKDDGPAAAGAARKLASSGSPAPIGPARAAPLRRWLARVWPAIALGPVQAALVKWQQGGLPLTLSDVASLLSPGGTSASASNGAGAVLAEHAESPAPQAHPDSSLVPGGREITFFVIFSFAVLLGFLISSAWLEVRSKYLYH